MTRKKDLESKLIKHIEDFLLELGKGFYVRWKSAKE
ncbi:MAG: DUF1016 domain-containing protein [Bacilli bacterium]|nr:MAG: DUF1016 domain-containing protein [Bacilli bacterium]